METRFNIAIELKDRDSCNGCPLINATICRMGFGRLIMYRRKDEALYIIRPLACKLFAQNQQNDTNNTNNMKEGCSHEWIDVSTKLQAAQGIKVELCRLCDTPARITRDKLEKTNKS